MGEKNLHVVRHGEDWAVRDEGSTQIISAYKSKQEAIDAARSLAARRKTRVVIHGRTGQALLKAKAPSGISEDGTRQSWRDGTLASWRGASTRKAQKKESDVRGSLPKARGSKGRRKR